MISVAIYLLSGRMAAFVLMSVISCMGTACADDALGDEPANRDCIHCHADDLKLHEQVLKQVQGKALEKCNQCHATGLTSGALNHDQALDKQVTQVNKAKNHKVAQQGSSSAGVQKADNTHISADRLAEGMHLPMYSSTSRMGPEPNKMTRIPAGKFTMGSNDRLPDEGPMHEVTLPAYYIDTFEVTNLQYKKFIDATQRRSPRYFRNRTFPEGKADHPVTYVNWKDANAYCQWAGKRLPNEHEWEKAARGTDARTYPWGNEFDSDYGNTPVRWEKLGVFGDTTPVGAFEKGVSPYGIHDMSGNVWEWTASWYQPHPGNKTPSESYGERYKILKGGSWWDCSFYKCGLSAPVYNRSFFAKNVKNDSFGFRCAKDANDNK